jgi:DNA-binding beta-propeller fold protein YncE
MLPRNVISGILFLVVLLPLCLGLNGCNLSSEQNFVSPSGQLYVVVYTYDFGACVGWKLVVVGKPVDFHGGGGGSDCSEIAPALRMLALVPASPQSDLTAFAGNPRPRTTAGSQGTLLLADAFTGVDAYDFATGAQLAVMPVQGNPTDLVSLPGHYTVYAVLFPSFGASPSIAVIDGAKRQITANIPLPANTFPLYGALSPDGSTLYVSNVGSSDFSASPNTSILAIRQPNGERVHPPAT